RRVLILGAGPRAARVEALAKREGAGFMVVGYVGMNDGPTAVTRAVNRGDIPNLAAHVVRLGASEVVLALEERRNALPLQDLLRTALLVKMESKGPAFFRQRRVGLYGQSFDILKLRSMRQDAEVAGKAVWAQKDDPRITRVGSIIRRLRIDELPQAWSVLRGDMSFVGPRP